ncbi:hypothetical protein, partial [Crenobacter intestini]
MGKYSSWASAKEEHFDDATSAARRYVQTLKERPVSDTTAALYLATYTRIRTNGVPDFAKLAGTDNSFRSLRSAWLYGAKCEMRDLLKLRDKQRREGDKDGSRETLQRITALLENLNFVAREKASTPKEASAMRTFDTMNGVQMLPTFAELKAAGLTKEAESTAKRQDATKWSRHGFEDLWKDT